MPALNTSTQHYTKDCSQGKRKKKGGKKKETKGMQLGMEETKNCLYLILRNPHIYTHTQTPVRT